MRTLIWFIYFWLYLLLRLPHSLYVRHLRKKDMCAADKLTARVVGVWAKRLLWLAGVHVEVRGKENIPVDPFVVMANHQGYFDIPIMLAHVGAPRALVAKQEINKLPGIRTWMRNLHCLFVDRSSVKAGAQTMTDGVRLIEEGYSLTIFPEGTRSKGGPVAAFKGGAFRIASKAGVPIVPVTIDGSYRIMEKNHMWIRPAHVTITIHPPVATAGINREELRDLPERIRETVVSAL